MMTLTRRARKNITSHAIILFFVFSYEGIYLQIAKTCKTFIACIPMNKTNTIDDNEDISIKCA